MEGADSPPPSQCSPDDGACSAPPLNAEQLAVVHAPVHQALAVLAAAGTGKTTTCVERVCFTLEQGIPAEQVLVLTFSRKAAAELQERLHRRQPTTRHATVATFHSWSWLLVRQHWAEAGLARRPTILAAEQQEAALMRDCIVWDRLAGAQADLRSWLFLPPTASWAEVAGAVAERHAPLYARCLAASVKAHSGLEAGGGAPQEVADAACCSLAQLPTRVQILLAGELHAAFAQRFRRTCRGGEHGGDAVEALAAAAKQAPSFLGWLEREKRQGRLPDAAAYAALCAGAGLSPDPEVAERQRQLLRVAADYQAELARQGLVTLGDLPLLARRLLAAGGEAAAEARERWSHVLCDEFQDAGHAMLDLLRLLLGERRSATVVGDDDQAIYSFLSATPQVFGDFRRHFGGRSLCLQTNFRSTPAICAFGTALLHGNRREAEKAMLPARLGACAPVLVRQFSSAAQEAAALAAEVQRLWREEGVPHSSVCVLLRCLRSQGSQPHAPLMAALRRLGIPYEVAGHQRLGEDPAVAALSSYLAASLEVDPAFEALLTLPLHGLGQDVRSAVSQQQAAARLAGLPPPSLLACAEQVCSQAGALSQSGDGPGDLSATQLGRLVSQLNSEDVAELRRLVLLLRRARRSVEREPLPQALLRVLRDSGLAAWLRQQQAGAEEAEEAEEAWRDVLGGLPQAGEAGGEEELPAPLRCVLNEARQLTAERQQQRGPTQQADAASAGAEGGGQVAADGEAGLQAAGEELVRELLARLATGTAADGHGHQAAERQQAGERRGDPGVLTLSTIHQAKGLEWPVVFVPSAMEGLLPTRFRPPSMLVAAAMQAGGEGGEPCLHALARQHREEERRLFHVAATRARDRLTVSYVHPPPPAEEPEDEPSIASAGPPPSRPAPDCNAADVAHCSSILACTVRRLRRQAPPGVLQLEGRLPEQDWPGLWDGGGELEDVTNTSGSHARPPATSIAEQIRQRVAAMPAAARQGLGRGVTKRVHRWKAAGRSSGA